MKKLLLVTTLLVMPPLAGYAEDFLAVTPGVGSNIGGKLATGGGFHPAHIIGDATDPRVGAPVDATKGLMTNNLAIGALADTASDGVNASIVSLLHQTSVNGKAGSAAPGTTSASAGAVQGPIATGSAQTSAPLPNGGIGRTAVPTAVADGQAVLATLDKAGRAVTLPYSVPELAVRGKATVVITTPATLLAASGTAGVFTYLKSMQCGNSSGTGVWVTLSDSGASYIYVPAGGGNNPSFEPPLVSSAANTAITAVGDSTQTDVKCVAEGWKG